MVGTFTGKIGEIEPTHKKFKMYPAMPEIRVNIYNFYNDKIIEIRVYWNNYDMNL